MIRAEIASVSSIGLTGVVSLFIGGPRDRSYKGNLRHPGPLGIRFLRYPVSDGDGFVPSKDETGEDLIPVRPPPGSFDLVGRMPGSAQRRARPCLDYLPRPQSDQVLAQGSDKQPDLA